MEEKWFSIWNTELTDYSKAGMYAENVIQSMTINNTKFFNKIKIRLNNINGQNEAIYKNIVLQLENGKKYLMTFNGHQEIRVSPGKTQYTDELCVKEYSGPITLTYKVSKNVIGNIALLPSTTYLHIKNEGRIDTLIPAYRDMVSSIPCEYNWHFGIDDISLCLSGSDEVKKILFMGDSNFHREYLVNAYREMNPYSICVNRGINGNRLLNGTIIRGIGEMNGKSAVKRMKTETGSYDKVFILIGINDIMLPYEYGILNEVVSAEDIIEGLKILKKEGERICGGEVVFLTLLPFKGHPVWNGLSESTRIRVNEWISRQNHIDTARIVADSDDLSKLCRDYSEEDSLHLNATGGYMVAKEMSRL